MTIHMHFGSTLRNIFHAILPMVVCLSFASCDNDDSFGIPEEEGIKRNEFAPRSETVETRRVVLFYECGFNTLHKDLDEDINTELVSGYLPVKGRHKDVILVFSKIAENGYLPVESYLRQIYDDGTGKVVSDTLLTFGKDVQATSPETMKEVLSYMKDKFPAKGYGMIFSSHGSGWLPEGYYYSPSSYENSHKAPSASSNDRNLAPSAVWQEDIPQERIEDDPFAGMVRSIGQDEEAYDKSTLLKEMTTSEFASGIPIHLDYLLFDMCYSAGVEVLYGLKDKADMLGLSCAEVLADGMFDYTKITSYLLSQEPDLTGLFKDSFKRYDQKTGNYRSSTVTLASTSGVDALAAVCKKLNDKYRAELYKVNYNSIQGFYRNGRHYFFDLEDTYEKCGATTEELAELNKAIDGCVLYKAATPEFISSFTIVKHCGFTTYVPSGGTSLLNRIYKEEAWDIATGLVY